MAAKTLYGIVVVSLYGVEVGGLSMINNSGWPIPVVSAASFTLGVAFALMFSCAYYAYRKIRA